MISTDSNYSFKNDLIGLDISYDQTSNQWRFSHLLFLLNQQNSKEQEIECQVKVCHKSLSGSACQQAAGNCLHCSGDANPCLTGNCVEAADFSQAECVCTPYTPPMGSGSLTMIGENCDMISTCSVSNPCQNGGVCIDDLDLSNSLSLAVGFDVNTMSPITLAATGYTCDCLDGFDGVLCENVQ